MLAQRHVHTACKIEANSKLCQSLLKAHLESRATSSPQPGRARPEQDSSGPIAPAQTGCSRRNPAAASQTRAGTERPGCDKSTWDTNSNSTSPKRTRRPAPRSDSATTSPPVATPRVLQKVAVAKPLIQRLQNQHQRRPHERVTVPRPREGHRRALRRRPETDLS